MRIPLTFLAGLACLTAPALAQATTDVQVVPSRISGVTVYTQGAVVKRTIRLQNADGSFLIQGVPLGADLASLRLRGMGCEVVSMETRHRTGRELDAAELDALNGAVAAARTRVERAADNLTVADAVVTYHKHVQAQIQTLMRADLASGDGDPDAWVEQSDFIKVELREALVERLAAKEALEQAKQQLALAEAALKNGGRTNLPDTYDVIVDLVDLPTKDIPRLELEYFVGQASWAPRYDLRASSDLSELEVVYNASVRQTTGEDWDAVPLVLSTARPQRGASGPDPVTAWVSLYDPDAPSRGFFSETASEEDFKAATKNVFRGSGGVMAPSEPAWAPAFANVDTVGLAVRFELPRPESVPSSTQDQVFPVGRATTALTAEHVAAPALSNLVWMRGKGTNDTPWSFLPGAAKVYVGGDFVGDAHIGSVPAGDEFTLPLGVDQRLSVERTRLADMSGDRGGFNSKSTQVREWRIVVSNFGGMTERSDGSVRLIVQEVLPTSTDERISVRLGDVSPALSKADEFKRPRDEQGILTWVLDVPQNGKAEIRWGYEVRWPEGEELLGL